MDDCFQPDFFLLYPFTAWLLLNTIVFKTTQCGLEVHSHDIWYLHIISWKINLTCYRNKHCTFLYYRCLLYREQVYFRNLTFSLYLPFISHVYFNDAYDYITTFAASLVFQFFQFFENWIRNILQLQCLCIHVSWCFKKWDYFI